MSERRSRKLVSQLIGDIRDLSLVSDGIAWAVSTQENDFKDNLSDAENVLGVLRRGRGRGLPEALESAPDMAWPLLVECVANDPEWDRDIKGRSEHHTSLVLATRIDLAPLRSLLKYDDISQGDSFWNVEPALSTFICLAERGND